MELSKQDVQNWREHPVTALFLEHVLFIMDIEMNHLATQAGLNPTDDRMRVGHIRGLAELADWEPDYIEDKVNAES